MEIKIDLDKKIVFTCHSCNTPCVLIVDSYRHPDTEPICPFELTCCRFIKS